MSGEVNKPQQLPPPTLGQVFYNTANKFAMVGAMTNSSVFCGCYIGYPIPGCFPISGLDADDIAIRMMPPPPAQNTIFNGTTTGSAFSDIPNFGNWFNTTPTTNPTGTTAASDGTKPSYLSAEQKQKTTNTAEVFSKIDSAKWDEMREKENKIAAKRGEMDKATGADKNTKAKELRALHQEYDKLDRELGGGSALSSRYGITDRTFYTNIDDETELSSIKDINGEIEQAQKELADTDEEYGKLLAEKESAAAQLRKEMGVFVTITDDMAKGRMSAQSREALEALTKQRAEKISDIESKIKELNDLIKKAGKDKDKYSITGDKIEDAKKDENEGNKTPKYILKEGKLVDKDGRPVSGEVEFNGKKYKDGVEMKQPAEQKPADVKSAEAQKTAEAPKPAAPPAPAPAEPKPAEAPSPQKEIQTPLGQKVYLSDDGTTYYEDSNKTKVFSGVISGGKWVINGKLLNGPSLDPETKDKTEYKDGVLTSYKVSDNEKYIFQNGRLEKDGDPNKAFMRVVDGIYYVDGKPYTGETMFGDYQDGVMISKKTLSLRLPEQTPTWSTPGAPILLPGTRFQLLDGTTIQL